MALPFVGASVGFMLLALTIGIFRLMAQNGVGPILLERLYPLHPLIMVFGFICGIIVTERIAGVELLPHTRETRTSLVMPPLIFAGVLGETAGYLWGERLVVYVGAALLVASSLLFLRLLVSFLAGGRDRLSVFFMILSSLSLLLASCLSAFSLPAGNTGFVMLLLLFPIIFVLGERVELTSLATGARPSGFAPALFLLAAAVALFGSGAFAALPASSELAAFAATGLAFGLFGLKERGARPKGEATPFRRYVSRHVGGGDGWGVAGSGFGGAYSLSGTFVYYDAFVHSLAIGFVGIMFLAHGPIILPMVLRRRFDDGSFSYAPLAILLLALFTRIGSELALVYQRSWLLQASTAASGWLVLIAVAAFFAEMALGTRRSARAPVLQSPRR